MTKPTVRHDYRPNQFPLTMRIYSGKTGELLWSRTVALDEARSLAKIEVPSYAGTDHYPVRAEVVCADGLKQKKVSRFWLQGTATFPDGAPQRESFASDAAYDRACARYAAEWRETYRCAGCDDGACPQCGVEGRCP